MYTYIHIGGRRCSTLGSGVPVGAAAADSGRNCSRPQRWARMPSAGFVSCFPAQVSSPRRSSTLFSAPRFHVCSSGA